MKTKKSSSNSNVKKTRKVVRKEKRKLKKVKRNEYFTNRNRGGKYVINPNLSKGEESPKQKQISKDEKVFGDQVNKMQKKEKKQQLKLQKQMQKTRKIQLKEANLDEERNIKHLEKQLKLNKRKSKSLSKAFAADGLDYILEMCDSESSAKAASTEQHLSEVHENFEEDFALMTGDSSKEPKENEDDFFISSNQISKSSNENESDKDDEESNGVDEMDDLKTSDLEETDSENEPATKKMKEDEEGENDESDKKGETWEDIYGRLRASDGSVISKSEEKYVPPAARGQVNNSGKLVRLKKQLKGFLNRLAESNMHNISAQIEKLYMSNSRNDMNDTLTTLIFDALVSSVITPERLLLEHILLISILHANIGTEVGAHFLQTLVKKFNELFHLDSPIEDKILDNVVNVIAQLYNFKLYDARLLYQILKKLAEKFTERDVECILLILKNVGFSLRKDDPTALKSLILELQKKANSASEEIKNNARVKYMLDILLAIKNNNMSKIPNYDPTYSEHLKKVSKTFIRKGNYITQLNISLEDLLKADERGRWWVVGSAWTGNIETFENKIDNPHTFSEKLLELARKQRMNTDTRRNIFCIIMSAEDYLDAYEKLLHLGLKNQQEREIVHVLVHCCLQEKKFNPYYAVLAQKFCENDRKFLMTIKFSVWDKLKTLTECSGPQLSNLAKLLTHLFLEKGLPISILKIVHFSELDKITLRFMRQILLGILLYKDKETCKGVFEKIVHSAKLKVFKESLRLFIHHFLLKNLNSDVIPEDKKSLLENRARIIENMLVEAKLKF